METLSKVHQGASARPRVTIRIGANAAGLPPVLDVLDERKYRNLPISFYVVKYQDKKKERLVLLHRREISIDHDRTAAFFFVAAIESAPRFQSTSELLEYQWRACWSGESIALPSTYNFTDCECVAREIAKLGGKPFITESRQKQFDAAGRKRRARFERGYQREQIREINEQIRRSRRFEQLLKEPVDSPAPTGRGRRLAHA